MERSLRKTSRVEAAEEARRLSEEKYKIIFENANDLIVYISSDGRFIEVNWKLEDIFGYRRADFVGKHYSEVGVLGPGDLERAMQELRNTVSGRPPEILEFQVRRKDGIAAFVEVNSRPIQKDGEITGSILIVRDITQRKKAEEEGLVHCSANTSEELVFICNCCSCHCGILGTAKRVSHASEILTSGYIALVDPELCSVCETCTDRCPVSAISMDDAAIVDAEQCIGCSLCVSTCPTGAIGLMAKPGTKIPPKTLPDLEAAMRRK